ncbi:MAG: hypothetical protein LBB23_04990 [Rickettsiales bacterium]|nr:hypothetical protein [Rickettsiales bacterium]
MEDESNHPVRLRRPPRHHWRGILLTTTPALRATPSPAKGNFVRLSSTNHPALRAPLHLGGELKMGRKAAPFCLAFCFLF